MFFTFGSVLAIGLLSKYLHNTILTRVFGALFGAVLFYLLTNFGVWINGSFTYTLDGLISCYILALPFFGNTLVSTLLFSVIIETVNKFYQNNFSKIN